MRVRNGSLVVVLATVLAGCGQLVGQYVARKIGPSKAAGSDRDAAIALADLAGTWAMTLAGETGCGTTTSDVALVLDVAGSGDATVRSHSSGCGDTASSGVPFTITALDAGGGGSAYLWCGDACGWSFSIHVSRDRSLFSLVDVTDPGNHFEGLAIRQ
jgi:hypothetical protein